MPLTKYYTDEQIEQLERHNVAELCEADTTIWEWTLDEDLSDELTQELYDIAMMASE